MDKMIEASFSGLWEEDYREMMMNIIPKMISQMMCVGLIVISNHYPMDRLS